MRIQPVISIVMPVYNGEKYLREAVESILAQTWKDFEFIIINDGSTDHSEEIILSYCDERIVYLKNNNNSGICVTLNKGINAARGKYIVRMDCDDISFPERLSVQLQFMEDHPEIAVAGSDIIVFGSTEKQLRIMPHNQHLCKMGLLFNSCLAHPSVIIRRNVLNTHGLHYKDHYRGREDFELWWQISKVANITNINKPLLMYRIHPGQVTQNYDEHQRHLSRQFIVERMTDVGCHLTPKQVDIISSYCLGELNKLNASHLNDFIDICKQIMISYRTQNRKEHYALKKTLSQAFLSIIITVGDKGHRFPYVLRMAKTKIMPINIYLQLLYLYIKGIL